jgi:hypothetical protein
MGGQTDPGAAAVKLFSSKYQAQVEHNQTSTKLFGATVAGMPRFAGGGMESSLCLIN